MEVTCQAPPATSQQQGRADLAVRGLVGGLDVLWLLAPDELFTVGSAEFLSLTIAIVVAPDTQDAGGSQQNSCRQREKQRMSS